MLRSVGKIQDGDEWLFVFDAGAPTYYSDIVTEMTGDGGVVKMSFAAVSTNGDGIRKAMVVMRLRMPEGIAWELCRRLKELQG
jgi:hypothetical protein